MPLAPMHRAKVAKALGLISSGDVCAVAVLHGLDGVSSGHRTETRQFAQRSR